VAQRPERLGGVDAAVVEFDPLTDPVRARAEDDDARLVHGRKRLVLLAPGRVEVVRRRLDLAGAGIDTPEDRADPLLVPAAAYLEAGEPESLPECVVAPARSLRGRDVPADEDLARTSDLRSEPRMEALRQVLVVQAGPGRGSTLLELARAVRLEQCLAERAPDTHRLPHRLHLRPERPIGAGELLEREAGELDDNVVERRLEACGRRLRQVVGDLVERVADRKLRRDLRDRIARR